MAAIVLSGPPNDRFVQTEIRASPGERRWQAPEHNPEGERAEADPRAFRERDQTVPDDGEPTEAQGRRLDSYAKQLDRIHKHQHIGAEMQHGGLDGSDPSK